MKNIIKPLIFLFAISLFVSCDEGGDPDPGATGVVEMAGDWYVQGFLDGEMIADYLQISTYNTAADDGTEMWIDDHGNFWDFKVKTPVNVSTLNFSGETLDSDVDGYVITVSITNGSVTKKGATSSGGNTVDGISFDAEFSDDPGTIYHLEGYKRTGLLEDEH
ncbi:lipid-binding protein [Kriegella aquimaris]|nr:lipid-binding protein [Kriegella aquimaris]